MKNKQKRRREDANILRKKVYIFLKFCINLCIKTTLLLTSLGFHLNELSQT